MNEIITSPAWKIAENVKNGVWTAEQVAKEFIARIDKLNPRLHAWVSLKHDHVFEQAKKVDDKVEKGPLAGVPFGVKDIFNSEVFPTKMGSPIWENHIAGNDSRCVSYVKRESGIVLGKTDTAEFAVHVPGKVLNPWNFEHVSGTSSGGSAVAVATGMAPVALGTQTAGSIIRPASWTGTYAMKPSFGLIARTGVLKTTDTLDNIGFYGRCPKDLELVLDSLRVRGRNYPIMEEELARYQNQETKKLRVGFLKGHFWEELPGYGKEAMLALVSKVNELENVEVVELELPESTKRAHELHRRIYNPCLSYYFREELVKAPELISDNFMSLVKDGEAISPEDYKFALEEQVELVHEVEEFVKKNNIDFLVHHSSNGSAPKGAEPTINKDLNLLWTLLWMPVVNIPQFKCPHGLPFGFQVTGPRYSDYKLFKFLHLLTENQVIPEIAELAPIS